jgi:CheY-like chemotaxis protein
LLNLLSNAAKFTEEGSITVSTKILAGPQGKEEVLVSVTDTGPGIAPEDQKKLFQPFSQVDGSLTRKTGGSGLGLSICQHLIQMHGGRIGLRSKVGTGSTFFFSLPILAVEGGIGPYATARPELPDLEAAQLSATGGYGLSNPETETPAADKQTRFQSLMEAQKRSTRPLSSAAVFGQGLILAIDPDHQVIDFYRRYLSNHGYTVIAVTELDQAVTVASGIYPSLITLDISMQSTKETRTGRLDGWQVLHALKTTPETQTIPVVICSLLDERQKAFDLGADDYLVKPILEHDLVAVIRRLRGGKTPPGSTPGNNKE